MQVSSSHKLLISLIEQVNLPFKQSRLLQQVNQVCAMSSLSLSGKMQNASCWHKSLKPFCISSVVREGHHSSTPSTVAFTWRASNFWTASYNEKVILAVHIMYILVGHCGASIELEHEAFTEWHTIDWDTVWQVCMAVAMFNDSDTLHVTHTHTHTHTLTQQELLTAQQAQCLHTNTHSRC